MESIEYKGQTYQVHEFTDLYRQVEPCNECCFGGRVSLGKYPHIENGVTIMKEEGGYTCNKPKGFQACTAVRRKDKRNVFFTKFLVPDKSEPEKKHKHLKNLTK